MPVLMLINKSSFNAKNHNCTEALSELDRTSSGLTGNCWGEICQGSRVKEMVTTTGNDPNICKNNCADYMILRQHLKFRIWILK